MSVALGTGQFLLGLSGVLRAMDVTRFTMSLSRTRPPRTVDPGLASDAVRTFYHTPVAFIICWLPWLGYLSGNIAISLLRDAGIKIVPWPILINSSLLAVWFLIAARLKFQRLTRTISAA